MLFQDLRQTPQYSQYMQATHWQVELLPSSKQQFFTKPLPFFPFLKVGKMLGHTHWLTEKQRLHIQSKHRLIVWKEEPRIIEKYQQSRVYFQVKTTNHWPVLPTKTLWINLEQSLLDIKKQFTSTTRRNLKKAQQHLTSTIVSGENTHPADIQNLYMNWTQSPTFQGLFKPKRSELEALVNSFGKQCYIVHVFYPKTNQVVASCLILCSRNMAFYWHNGTTHFGKLLAAPTLFVWEAMKEAQKRHLKIFDLEGMWDERFPNLNSGWQGFTKFKQGFVKKLKYVDTSRDSK